MQWSAEERNNHIGLIVEKGITEITTLNVKQSSIWHRINSQFEQLIV